VLEKPDGAEEVSPDGATEDSPREMISELVVDTPKSDKFETEARDPSLKVLEMEKLEREDSATDFQPDEFES